MAHIWIEKAKVEQALEAFKKIRNCTVNVWDVDDEIKILEQAIAEESSATQEPVAKPMTAHRAAFFMERFRREKLLGPNEKAAVDFVIAMLDTHPQPKAEQEFENHENNKIMAQANYDAGFKEGFLAGAKKTLNAWFLHESEKSKPVAWVSADELEELSHCNGMSVWAENALIHTEDSISKQMIPSGYLPLYTHPPQRSEDTQPKAEHTSMANAWFKKCCELQDELKAAQEPKREWVGLTDEDFQPMVWKAMMYYGYDPKHATLTSGAGFYELVRAIEAKLKEKNA